MMKKNAYCTTQSAKGHHKQDGNEVLCMMNSRKERVRHQSNFYSLSNAVKTYRCPVTMQVIPSKKIHIFDDKTDSHRLQCHKITAVGDYCKTFIKGTFKRVNNAFTIEVMNQLVFVTTIDAERSYSSFKEIQNQEVLRHSRWIVLMKELTFMNSHLPLGQIMKITSIRKSFFKSKFRERRITCTLYPSGAEISFPVSLPVQFSVCESPNLDCSAKLLSEVCDDTELPCLIRFASNQNDDQLKNLQITNDNLVLNEVQAFHTILVCKETNREITLHSIPLTMEIDVEVLHGELPVATLNKEELENVITAMIYTDLKKGLTEHQTEKLSAFNASQKYCDNSDEEDEETVYSNVADLLENQLSDISSEYEPMFAYKKREKIEEPTFLQRDNRITAASVTSVKLPLGNQDFQQNDNCVEIVYSNYSGNVSSKPPIPPKPIKSKLTSSMSTPLKLETSMLKLSNSLEPLSLNRTLTGVHNDNTIYHSQTADTVEGYLSLIGSDSEECENILIDSSVALPHVAHKTNSSVKATSCGGVKYSNKWEMTKDYEDIENYSNNDDYADTAHYDSNSMYDDKNLDFHHLTRQESNEKIQELSVNEIGNLLRMIGFEHHISYFNENFIDGCLIVDLQEDDYLSLNLTRFEAKKMMNFVNGWRPKITASPSTNHEKSSFSVSEIAEYLYSINYLQLSDFCKHNQIDGYLLFELIKEESFLEIIEEHHLTMKRFEVVKLRKIFHENYKPKYF